ncbi:MAG: beta-Ala-His dipeptidase [Lachnospiraceae bacterium]|nr:beta-Ala-His dipeptidase [Lachnospiraceae bacterium]
MEERKTGVLQGYEPQQVLTYFEQICSIPHGSGNTAQISNWIVRLAKEQKLSWEQDEFYNVIVRIPASKGYEALESYMIQGHMDMVAVKTKDCPLNLDTDSLELEVKDHIISAKGTSLGGDDGIAVAYMLTIMCDASIPHPALELVFTTDEEIGLKGISLMDVSSLQSQRLINLDTEDEGVLIAGCAGGIKNVCRIPIERRALKTPVYKVTVAGLSGGHSGMEIHKEKGNANLLMARVLWSLKTEVSIELSALYGGEKDNAIPETAWAVFASSASAETIYNCVKKLEEELHTELAGKDDGVCLCLEKIDEEDDTWQSALEHGVLTEETFQKLLLCLMMNPNGVQAMSSSIPGTVETSLNCGIMRLEQESFLVRYAIRSSVKSAKTYLQQRMEAYVRFLGGTVTTEGDYPPWEYKADSPFREYVMRLYAQKYKKDMDIQVIHAGLECGYLSEQLADLDCISIGPDMKHIHTTEETLDIESVKRVWEFLLEILQDKSTK